MPKKDTGKDKHAAKEALRAVGSGSHIIRDALHGKRGTPKASSSTSIPSSSARLHRQQTLPVTTPATTSRQTQPKADGRSQPKADRRSVRHPRNPADQFIKQGGTKGFACTQCTKSYVSMQYARHHVKTNHSDIFPARAGPSSAREQIVYECPKCDYVGSSKHGLSIHNGSVHKNS